MGMLRWWTTVRGAEGAKASVGRVERFGRAAGHSSTDATVHSVFPDAARRCRPGGWPG